MEFLEDNEEARLMAAEMFIYDNLIGEFMNPEGEQEIEDNRIDEFIQQEEFEHIDPDYMQPPPEDNFEKSFRPIEVRPLEILCIEASKAKRFFPKKSRRTGSKACQRYSES